MHYESLAIQGQLYPTHNGCFIDKNTVLVLAGILLLFLI